MATAADIEQVVAAIKQSKKYGNTHEGTVRELAAQAVGRYRRPKEAIKAVRTQLHSIMAPYLGDPDYEAAAQRLTMAFAAQGEAGILAVCGDCLAAHLSTRERLPILAEFYGAIFGVTGRPQTILDIACGLNPLALRWMGLGSGEWGAESKGQGAEGRERLRFYAYDIHEARVAFINHYLRLEGLLPLARVQDVAGQLPQERGDVALFLKEMPRFVRNYGEVGRPLLEALNVRWLVVSYPTVSTHGGRNLTSRYRDFMHQLIDGHSWPLTELLFAGELVFVIQKEESDHEWQE